MLSLGKWNPDNQTYVGVDPTRWATEQVKAYIERLEAEVLRLHKENRSLTWQLAAAFEEQRAAPLLEQIRELLDTDR